MRIDINIPSGAQYILETLNNNGFEAYVVGGCVRDSILGIDPSDWDICTNALPKQTKSLFNKTIDTGLKHGTITVVFESDSFEVTTFRIDGNYTDGRRPDRVEFTSSLKKDLSRRDFTINAMACDINGELYDYFCGYEDIECRVIVCVGKAKDRFSEDALRQLRAIRFACKYNFTICESTYDAIDGKIGHISKERIRDEFNKILTSKSPSDGIYDMYKTGMLKHLDLTELERCFGFNQNTIHHDRDVAEHTLKALDCSESDLLLRLSILLHDIGKPDTYEFIDGRGTFYQHHKVSADITTRVMKFLKYSNEEIDIVNKLVYNHMSRYYKYTKKNVKKLINRVNIKNLDRLFKLMICDRIASNPPFEFDDIYKLKFTCEKFLNEEQPLSVKDLDIDGYDLMRMGISQGRLIGEILDELFEMVLEDETKNSKYILVGEVNKLLKDMIKS